MAVTITAEVCQNIIKVYSLGDGNEHQLIAALARAWLDHEAQVGDYWQQLKDQEEGIKALQKNIRSFMAERSKMQAEIRRLGKLLHDLTPTGSEFVGQPDKCASWIRQHIADLTDAAVSGKGEANQLREQVAAQQAKIEQLQEQAGHLRRVSNPRTMPASAWENPEQVMARMAQEVGNDKR